MSTGARRAAAETKAAVKGVGDQAERDTKRISLMGPAMRRTLALATVGLTLFAGASVVAFKKSIDAASNLTEQVNKTRVVFAGAEKDVLAWSKTTTQAIGISQRAALEYAGTFGNMLVPMGFARKEAAQMSMQLVQLAGDMASFNNASPEETLEALRAGLAGETEPLRRFGVRLNEARIQQVALNAGLIEGKEKLTDAGKAMAIMRIILKDTTDQQGDAARTIKEHAGQQRVLSAVIEDSAARLGNVFKPAVTAAMRAVNEWLGDEENVRMLERWAETLEEGVATALRGIAAWISHNREDLAAFFRDAASLARDAAKAFGELAGAANDIAKAMGGWDEAIKFGALGLSLAKLRGKDAIGSGGLLGAAAGASMLRSRLLALKNIGPLSIAVAVNYLQGMIPDDSAERKAGRVQVNGEVSYDPLTGKFYGGSGANQIPIPESLAAKRAGLTVEELRAKVRGSSTSSSVGDSAADKAAVGKAARGVQLTTSQKTTHQTSGLGGFPAKDWFATAGTPVLAPENGRVVRWSGSGGTSGQVYGWSLYYVGDETGNTYFITHIAEKRAPVGSYKKGDVLGYISAWDGGAPHAHVGIRKGGVATPTPDTAGGDYDPVATGADTSDPKGTGAGAKKAGIDRGELSRARSKAGWIEAHVDLIVSPTLRARLRQRAATIAKTLADVTDPKAFATATRNLNALDRDWAKAVELNTATKQAKATARNIGSALGRMPEALQKELGPRLAQVERELGNVTSKRQLEGIRRRMDELNAIIKAGVDKMRETVERGRDGFTRALGRGADKALQVLDAKTEELLRKARALIGGELLGEGDLGPAGRALRDFRAARAAADRASSRSSALAAAETEEERAALAAQHALEDQEEALQRAADEEERAIAEGLERERARIRDERAILRERFQGRYEEIVRGFQEETLTAEQAQQALLDLLADPEWKADFENAGALVGAAFANSFTAALDAVAQAVRELRDAINSLDQATGRAPSLPVGWTGAAGVGGGPGGKVFAFAHGGRVPGRYVGRADTVMAQVTPGEYVLDRGLSRRLEAALASGLGGGTTVAKVYLDSREIAVAIAQPISDEQARTIGYRSRAI